jgi:hypothetical protein
MNVLTDKSDPLTAIHTDLGAIFVSLELSRSSWLITSLSPGGGEKMSKHSVRGGDFARLMQRFAQLQENEAADRSKLSHHPCSRGWSRRVLDSPGAPERRHRKPRRRRGLDCNVAPPPEGKDRQDRW